MNISKYPKLIDFLNNNPKARDIYNWLHGFWDYVLSVVVIHLIVAICTALWSLAVYGWSNEVLLCVGFTTLFSFISSFIVIYSFLDKEDSNVWFRDHNFAYLFGGLSTGICISLAFGSLYAFERWRIDLIPPPALTLSSIIAVISIIMAIVSKIASWQYYKEKK